MLCGSDHTVIRSGLTMFTTGLASPANRAQGDRHARQPRQPTSSRRPQEHRAPARAEQGLREMIRTNEQITFCSLARARRWASP
jgi:hypothetical protein